MTHPNRRAEKTAIEARRRQVASLLLAGVENHSQIADQVGVSRPTIVRDVAAIEAEWREAALQDISAAKGQDLKRTNRLIGALWTKALAGDERSAKMVLDLMQHRAKLLGLNAPEKRELTGMEGEPLVIQIQRLVKEGAE